MPQKVKTFVGILSFGKDGEKKPKKNEKTPQFFFVEDIDNMGVKCYN